MRGLAGAAVALAVLGASACVAPPTAADRALALATPVPEVVGGVLAGGPVDAGAREAAVARAAASVVRVRNRTCDGVGTGSGFVLDAHRLVTNKHVVEGARTLSIDTRDGRQRTVEVAAAAVDADLAVVTTAESLPEPLQLAPQDPQPGALVTVLGFPLGEEFTREDGRLLDVVDGDRFDTAGDVLRSDVAVRPGSSGGPLLDVEGRVAGVVFAVEVRNAKALALPVSRLRTVLGERSLEPVETSCGGA